MRQGRLGILSIAQYSREVGRFPSGRKLRFGGDNLPSSGGNEGGSPFQDGFVPQIVTKTTPNRPFRRFLKNVFKAALTASSLSVMAITGKLAYDARQELVAWENQMIERSQNKLDQSKASVPWPSNTKVYTSTLQEENAYGGGFPWRLPEMNYSKQLLAQLDRDDIYSLDEAQQEVEKGLRGFSFEVGGTPQVPVSSTNPIRGWQKFEKKQRFVLIITGNGDGGQASEMDDRIRGLALTRDYEKMFLNEAASLKYVLQKNYDIPDNHFEHLVQPSLADIHRKMQWLQVCQQSHPDAEVMVYLSGHGNAGYFTALSPEEFKKQGSAEGLVKIDSQYELYEHQMKYYFNQYLSKFKVAALVIPACHSGAWIAQHDAPQPKLDAKV